MLPTKKNLRKYTRKNCIIHADLVYKKPLSPKRTYVPVWIIDMSNNGLRVSARNCIEIHNLIGIRFKMNDKEEYESVKFIWMNKIGNIYYLGLRISNIY